MYQVEFERTLFDNLYKEYRRKDLPDNITDLVAILKAEETIKGLSDYVTDYTQFVKEQDKPLPDEATPASKAVFDIPSPS